jgi:hypothetical protein
VEIHNFSCFQEILITWPSAHKIMLTVFWDSEDPLCEHYQQVQHRYRVTVIRAAHLDTATSYLHTTEKKKYRVLFYYMTMHSLKLLPKQQPSFQYGTGHFLATQPVCQSWLLPVTTYLDPCRRQWVFDKVQMMRWRQCIICFAYNQNPLFWKPCRQMSKVYWEAWRLCSEILHL